MSFENVQFGRVLQGVGVIFVISVVLWFGLGFCYGMVRAVEIVGNLDPDLSEEEQNEQMQAEIEEMLDDAADGSSEFNTIFMLQWSFTALITFFVSRRIAVRNASTPPQATAYGVSTGLGIMMVYSLCICSSAVNAPIMLIFLALILAAGYMGGQMAGPNLGKFKRDVPGAAVAGSSPGGNPETYYNMGVSAALGGRPDEARQHFTRVLQMNPRHVPAWLQLANLAETPEKAWEYVQQARIISPNEPAVQDAIKLIWPKVSASAGSDALTNQPPYMGGAQDEPDVPRTTPPGSDDDNPLF